LIEQRTETCTAASERMRESNPKGVSVASTNLDEIASLEEVAHKLNYARTFDEDVAHLQKQKLRIA
jgi:hypothetical protein